MANLDLKNPTVQKTALSVVLSVGLLSVFFFTHFLPFNYPVQRDKVNALKADYEKKSSDLARARATVADLPRFEAEYGQLHERWVLASELLPTDHQFPALLRKITLAGQQSGVSFVLFRPNPPKTEQYYTEMPVQVSVMGGYHQVGSFMAELANLHRIVTVRNLSMKSSPSGSDPLATTSADFTASAYSLNTAPVAPAAAPAPGADKKKEGASHARKSS